MLTYDEMVRWTNDYKVINNRIDIINQLLVPSFQHSGKTPCSISYKCGTYSVAYDGCEIASFGVYDVDGSSAALAMLDAWSDCVWHLGRTGFITQH